jgi:hypothetical protein
VVKKKNVGNIIRNWQLHHLTVPTKSKKLLQKRYPNALLDPGPMIFTGTVVNDSAGRWAKGFHMRSSLITSINRKKGIIKTQNTVYNVVDEGGDVFPDIGNDVLKIFY